MTTLEELTTEQLKTLCIQSDRVILTGTQLREVYQTQNVIDILDRGWEKCSKVASTPQLLALQYSGQSARRAEFELERFLQPDYRTDCFERLFKRVDQITNRSEIVRSCYNRTSEHFDRNEFLRLTKKKQNLLSDYEAFMVQIGECIKIIKDLHSLIIKK